MATDWKALQLTVLRLAMADQRSELFRTLESLRLPLVDVYVHILQPVFGMIEDQWFASELTLERERCTFQLIERLVSGIVPWPKVKKPFTLLSGAVTDEDHEVGVRMVANLFDEAGWQILHLGADAPTDVVLAILAHRPVHGAAFSVTLDQHLPALARLLEQIATLKIPTVTIIGGPAVSRHPDTLLADLLTPALGDVVASTERLVASRSFPPPSPPQIYPPCLPQPDPPPPP
jgi:methylmalonyl-CoA mutase cobalamin-binding subunit